MHTRYRRVALTAAIVVAAVGAAISPALAKSAIRPHVTRAATPTGKAPGDSTTLLGFEAPNLIVDSADDVVFASDAIRNDVAVSHLNGIGFAFVSGIPNAGQLAFDGQHTVYAAEVGHNSIAAFSPTTLGTATPIALPSNACVDSLTYADSAVWFTYTTCGGSAHGLGRYEPADASVTTYPEVFDDTADGAAIPVSLPGDSGRLVTYLPNVAGGEVKIWDISGTTPTSTAGRASWSYQSSPLYAANCTDATALPGGTKIAIACTGNPGTMVLNTSDLSLSTVLTTSGKPDALAVSPDGTFLAAAATNILESEQHAVDVTNVSGSVPGSVVRGISYDNDCEVAPGDLAWSNDGRLYAIESACNGHGFNLVVTDDADKIPTSMTATAPWKAAWDTTIHVTGTLTPATGVAETASVQLVDDKGTFPLPNVTIATNGTFAFANNPKIAGTVQYEVVYAGDATHAGTGAAAGTRIDPLAFDVNADGYADLVVGSAGEGISTATGAGMFHVLPSHASGVTGTGSVGITQNTSGVPGVAEKNGAFGWSEVSGDFNGDGYADVAVSSPGEGVGSVVGAGSVTVFYGSASGLKTSGVQLLTAPAPVTGGDFGEAMAVGDFNGDGVDDLAVGEPGNDAVCMFQGITGYPLSPQQAGESIPVSAFDTAHPASTGQLFGFSLAAGDVNGDGSDDLAIGAPGNDDDHGYAAGAVYVVDGFGAGITPYDTVQMFTKDTPGVPGSEHSFGGSDLPDSFGEQVALADFNGDGRADLGVGAPGSPVTTSDGVTHQNAGTVTVMYSSGSAIGTANAVEVTQATAGMPGNPGAGDQMGLTLTAGDSNGDGKADVAIYSPGDHYVTIVKGGATGLTYATAVAFTQASAGIVGTSAGTDLWGDCLRFENFKGTGPQGLVVGAPGKHGGAGSVTVMYSSTAGLTGQGSVYFDQNSTGVPGTAEPGDAFGSFFDR